MYYMVIYNTQTGQIGVHSSTHGVDDGLIPPGNFAKAGEYEDPVTDATVESVLNNPAAYLYQNGAYVNNPNYDANAVAIQQAQTAKLAELKAGYDATIAAGFQCAIGSTTYTFGWRDDDVHNDQLHLTQLQQAIDKDVETFPVNDYADINGNTVVIPDQATLTALDTKANAFGWAQVKQLRALVKQVNTLAGTAGTTPAQIQAIVWTTASY